MPDFPAHASPAIAPFASSSSLHARDRSVSELKLSQQYIDDANSSSTHPSLVSPALTPPRTPSVEGQRHDRQPKSIPVAPERRQDDATKPDFLERLPEVRCEVRARIPTTTGTEMWLHLYTNNVDNKEHLAIVFGPHIKSKSLNAVQPGETERDRMIRGAYVGSLYPGRTSSRVDQLKADAGVLRPRSSSGSSSPGLVGPSSPLSNSFDSVASAHDLSCPAYLGPPLVRIHSECYTGETVWSARCDCGEQLDEAARLMSLPAPTPASTPGSDAHSPPSLSSAPQLPSAGGVIIYLRQEGRGIGLLSKLKAYNLQDLGHDTMEANLLLRHPGDARSYGLATAMLMDLGLGGGMGIRLLTNNPEKVRAVEGPNMEVRVAERVPMIPLAWKTGGKEGINSPEVERYISTKIEKFKHMFSG